jgi:hypothetical protein
MLLRNSSTATWAADGGRRDIKADAVYLSANSIPNIYTMNTALMNSIAGSVTFHRTMSSY